MAPIFLRFSTFLLATIACFGVHAQGSGTSTRERNLQETQAVLMAEASEANALAEKLRQVAATVDNDSWIGTMYNEVDSKKHTCYILGKLLGQEDAVRHLRFSRNPSLRARDSGDAHSLRVNAQSLENFSYTVNRTLRIT